MAFAFWQSRRLTAVTTLDGIIVDWNLFAANADERIGAQEVLENHRRVWNRAMNRARRVIETTFAQAKGAFGLEKSGARSLWGLQRRLIAKPVNCKAG